MPRPGRDRALAELAGRQHGVVTIAQLRALGFTDSAVGKRVRAGRLHRVHRGVYAVGHAGLSQEGVWMAAVLWAGPGAGLSHLAAAVLWRVWRGRVRVVDVVSPRGRAGRGPVRSHRCRNLDPRDVTCERGVPVTTVPRTLVDLADVLDAHRLANVVHEAAFRDLFDAVETREAMERAHGRRGLPVLERALAAHASGSAGTRSGLEDRFLSLVARAGLPAPLVNTQVAGIEVGFHWPERNLCVEVDGPGHVRPRTRAQDARRDAMLEVAGQAVMRVSGEEMAAGVARVRAGLDG